MYTADGHGMKTEQRPTPFINCFTSYEDWELVLSQAYKLGGKQKRITTDLPVTMKKERGRLIREAYRIRKEEKLQTLFFPKPQTTFLTCFFRGERQIYT